MKIALVAPSSPVDPVELEKGLAILRERFGPLEILESPGLRKKTGYLAGTDADRLADFEWAFASEAELVWFARGGFGATRLLEKLDWERLAGTGKRLIGYSDATAALAAFFLAGGRALHGPMVAADLTAGNSRTLESLSRILFEKEEDHLSFEGRRLSGPPLLSGPVLAGNLTVLAALAGTRFLPRAEGSLVFLEEIREEPYRVDRLLTQLLAAGFFEGALGVIIGSMKDCVPETPEKSFTLEETLRDFASRSGLAVLTGFPFGHGGTNTLLPWGAMAAIREESEGRFFARVAIESTDSGGGSLRRSATFSLPSGGESGFRRFVESMSEEYVFYQKDASGTLTYVSPSVKGILGYQQEEMRARYSDFFTDNPINALAQEYIAGTLLGVQQPTFEIEARHKNGDARRFEIFELPVRDESGRVVMVEGIAHDITERRRRLKVLQRLEREAVVGRVAASIAHEVNNPLAVIKTRLTLMREDLVGNEKLVDGIDVVTGQVDRIGRTTGALLFFARQGARIGAVESLRSVLVTVVNLFERTMERAGIALAVPPPSEIPEYPVRSDGMQQVFVNLFQNATEAMPRGGMLTVTVEKMPSALVVTLTDTGPGFEANPERLFESFFTTKDLGTGLGLAVVKRIVGEHGGVITARNSSAGGAEFVLQLPTPPVHSFPSASKTRS